MHIRSLEDLKAKLLSVIIVVLGTFFLEQVITWDGRRDILALGIAEALVIAVIVLAIRLQVREAREAASASADHDEANQ